MQYTGPWPGNDVGAEVESGMSRSSGSGCLVAPYLEGLDTCSVDPYACHVMPCPHPNAEEPVSVFPRTTGRVFYYPVLREPRHEHPPQTAHSPRTAKSPKRGRSGVLKNQSPPLKRPASSITQGFHLGRHCERCHQVTLDHMPQLLTFGPLLETSSRRPTSRLAPIPAMPWV